MTRALIISGSIGSGHDTVAQASRSALEEASVETMIVDAMAMLGRRRARIGERTFRWMMGVTPLYDAFHFAQLRDGGRLAVRAEQAAVRNMAPRLDRVLASYRPDLIVSVYATGAAAAARHKQQSPATRTVVVMTDSFAHRMWVHDHTDLFVVTSALAAASVRRFRPSAAVAIVPGPVRKSFEPPPDRAVARHTLGLGGDGPCAVVMAGGWGVGPVERIAVALSAAGVHVLAVAGTDRRLFERLRRLDTGTVDVFGWTDRIPELMAAADVVVTTSGDTCREARVVGRPLVLLDAVPGHGRENLMHELELGGAAATTVDTVVDTVRHVLQWPPQEPQPAGAFAPAFVRALTDRGSDAGSGDGLQHDLDGAGRLVVRRGARLSELGQRERVGDDDIGR